MPNIPESQVQGLIADLASHAGTDVGHAPNAITGSPALAFWYKASSLGLADGTAVTTWTDSSGNSRDVTQATSTKRPLYKTSVTGLGGAPAVLFDGVDDTLVNAAVSGFGSSTWTVFGILTENVNAAGLFALDARVSGGFIDLCRSSGNPAFRAGDSSIAAALNAPTRGAALWVGVTDGTTLTLFVNGQMVAQAPTSAGSVSPTSIYVGSNADSAGSYWSGHIAEVGVFSTALTAAQRGELRRYAAATYGVMSWGP